MLSSAFIPSLFIFLAALASAIALSERVNLAFPTVGGAVLVMALGYVPLAMVVRIWDLTWDATFTLVGLLLIAHLLDEAGLFGWVAMWIARAARGRGWLAWLGLMLMTTAVTVLLANDGGVLVMTPIVAEFVLALGWPRSAMLAFLLSAGFLVDATSTLLVTANLTNIIAADAFSLSWLHYLGGQALAWLGIVLASFGILAWRFRRELRFAYDPALLPEPVSMIRNRPVFMAGWWVLGGLVVAYLINSALQMPTALLVGTGALFLSTIALNSGGITWSKLLRTPPWHVVFFAQGMFIMVQAISDHGLQHWLSGAWQALGPGPWPQAFGIGLSETLLSSVTNNLPALLMGVLAIQGLPPRHGTLLPTAAALIGADLGSKLTPIGSLATLMWIYLLRRKGFRVGWDEYMRFALVVTPPVLAIALGVLAWHLGYRILQ